MRKAVSSTGVLNEIRRETNLVQKTVQLPDFSTSLPEDIDKIIIQGGDFLRVNKDSNTTADQVEVFGSFKTIDEDLLTGYDLSSLVLSRKVGNIMYFIVNDPPISAHYGQHSQIDMTVSAPSNVKIHVRDADGKEK